MTRDFHAILRAAPDDLRVEAEIEAENDAALAAPAAGGSPADDARLAIDAAEGLLALFAGMDARGVAHGFALLTARYAARLPDAERAALLAAIDQTAAELEDVREPDELDAFERLRDRWLLERGL